MRKIDNVQKVMFGYPRGIFGRLGGILMARISDEMIRWVTSLLDIQPQDRVLEVGLGPGVGIHYAAEAAYRGVVAGIDVSETMLEQARRRNAANMRAGRVQLHRGTATALPFADESFDKAMAMNSLHLWPDAMTGLRELHRVLTTGGAVAISFTPHSGQSGDGLEEMLQEAGFTGTRLYESELGVCVLAIR